MYNEVYDRHTGRSRTTSLMAVDFIYIIPSIIYKMNFNYIFRLCFLASLLLNICQLFAASPEGENTAFSVYRAEPTKSLTESDVYTVFVSTPGSAEWQQVPVWN